MASSTAPTTISGSMPFSRLNSSMLWYKALAIDVLTSFTSATRGSSCAASFLDLGNQLRLFNVRKGNIYSADAGLPAFRVLLRRRHIDRDAVSGRAGQTSLPVAVVADRLKALH